MNKFNAGKASFWAITAVAIFASFLLGRSLTGVSAQTQDPWNCNSDGPQCGTNIGHRLVCPESYTRDGDICKKFIPAVYSCDFIVNFGGSDHNVGEFYIKPTGDDNHCHKIVWHELTPAQKSDFVTMNGGTGGVNDYNRIIDENPTAILQAGTGVYVTTDPISQSCTAGDPRYDSCTPAGQCPDYCGYQGGDVVADGRGGTITCPATEACGVNQDCLYHYTSCPVCGTGTRTLVIDTQPSGEGAACPTEETISCGELPACENGEIPPPVPTSTPTPVLGTSTGSDGGDGLGCATRDCSGNVVPQGQVLGASTLAGTGTFTENLYLAIMGLGGTLSTLGFALYKKALKLA